MIDMRNNFYTNEKEIVYANHIVFSMDGLKSIFIV
jgi:hypothetical protein